jgi:hypothetical protein
MKINICKQKVHGRMPYIFIGTSTTMLELATFADSCFARNFNCEFKMSLCGMKDTETEALITVNDIPVPRGSFVIFAPETKELLVYSAGDFHTQFEECRK